MRESRAYRIPKRRSRRSRFSNAPSTCSKCWPPSPDQVSLKVIAERSNLHPRHGAPHPQRPDHRALRRSPRGRQLPPGHAPARARQLVKARLDVRFAALAPMRELRKLTHQPVNLSMRQGDGSSTSSAPTAERAPACRWCAIGGRAPLHLTSVGSCFPANDDPQRVRAYAATHRAGWPTRNSITNCPRWSASGARQPAEARRDDEELELACAWRPASATTRASGGRPVDLGAGRPAGGILDERLKATAAQISASLGCRG